MARPGRLTPNSPAFASSKTETSTRWTDSTYLADVITRIVGGHPQSQIEALTPWAYAEHATGVA